MATTYTIDLIDQAMPGDWNAVLRDIGAARATTR